MASWHTELERDLIRDFGGTPRQGYGVDGMIDGRPVEVRAAKKDDRFRLGCDVHDDLLAQGGSYIFDDVTDNQPPRQVPAAEVDRLMGEGPCYEDRGYPHRFVDVDLIF